MGIIVIHHLEGKSVFEQQDFIQSSTAKYIRFFNKNGEEFSLELPKYFKEQDLSGHCDIVPLHTYIYDRESDIYQLHFEKHFLGYIFSTAVFYSEVITIKEYYKLSDFLQCSFYKLLLGGFEVNTKLRLSDIHDLTDLFPSLVIGAVSGEIFQKAPGFRIEDFRFSFLEKGYTLLERFETVAACEYPYRLPSRVHEKKLNLQKQNSLITTEKYIVDLYTHNLLRASSILERFVLIYQVVELFIDKLFSSLIDNYLIEFNQGKITKNELREKLIEVSKEKPRIIEMFEKSKVPEAVHQNFTIPYQNLCNNLGIKFETDWRTAFYSFRNILIHNYRILYSQGEILQNVMFGYEMVVISLLLNFKEQETVKSTNDSATI